MNTQHRSQSPIRILFLTSGVTKNERVREKNLIRILHLLAKNRTNITITSLQKPISFWHHFAVITNLFHKQYDCCITVSPSTRTLCFLYARVIGAKSMYINKTHNASSYIKRKRTANMLYKHLQLLFFHPIKYTMSI